MTETTVPAPEALRREPSAQLSPAGKKGSAPRDLPVALGLWFAFLLVYLKTLCPTVYLGDSGEFCTAIVTGGVPHPPGYPLFSLLGRLALVLVPFGEPAFRIGCLVALAGASAIALLYLLAREVGASPLAAGATAAVFGATYTFWSQATRVEVYTLSQVLVILTLLFGIRYRRTGSLATFSALVLTLSLALAHHLTIVLLLPSLALLCGRRAWCDPGRGSRLLVLLALAWIGPSLYFLLLLWAKSDPLQAWGRPVTLHQLWLHASARLYRGVLRIPDWPHFYDRLKQFPLLLWDGFPYFTFLLSLVGLARLRRSDRTLAAALAVLAGLVIAFNFCYRIGDIAPYYLTAWLVAAVLIGLAIDAVRERIPDARTGRSVAVGLAVVLPAVFLLRNWSACDLSRATWAREFARHKLESTDANGVLVTSWDPDTFPIWYVQDVLGVRPDVLNLDRAMLYTTWIYSDWDTSMWYLHRLRKKGVELPDAAPGSDAERERLADDGYLLRLLEGPLRERRVCTTFASTAAAAGREEGPFLKWVRERNEPLPQGLVLALQPKGTPVDVRALLRRNRELWDRIELPDIHLTRTDQDMTPDYLPNHYACMLVNFGGVYELNGDLERAETVYKVAADWAPSYRQASQALSAIQRRKSSPGSPEPSPDAGAATSGSGPRG